MTTDTTPIDLAEQLRPRWLTEAVADLERILYPAPPTEPANTAQAALPPADVPAADAAIAAVDALERYAGPALAAPVTVAVHALAGDARQTATYLDHYRDTARTADQLAVGLARDLASAHRALAEARELIAATVYDLTVASNREARLAAYAADCASAGRVPSAARTAAVLREADKATDRAIAEARALLDERDR